MGTPKAEPTQSSAHGTSDDIRAAVAKVKDLHLVRPLTSQAFPSGPGFFGARPMAGYEHVRYYRVVSPRRVPVSPRHRPPNAPLSREGMEAAARRVMRTGRLEQFTLAQPGGIHA